MYPTNGSNNQNIDLPITAICIVSDKSRCPPNYTPIVKANDTGTEPDLWKDSLFGKKINRFFCFTKDYPINEVPLLNKPPNIDELSLNIIQNT